VKNLLDQLATGQTLSRRHALRLLGIMGGGAALAGTGLSVLAAGAGTDRVTVTLKQDAGERPELVVGVAAFLPNLDPGQGGASSIAGSRISPLFFEPLLDVDYLASEPPGSGSAIVPNLAASWERIDDLTVEVVLRDDILFHDGTPVTSEDVKFTIDRVIGPDAAPETAIMRASFITYASVEIIDERTFRIITATPDAALEKRMASLRVVSKASVEELGLAGYAQKPVGTGPYAIVEYDPADHLILEAFDDYFGGPPPFSRVTFRMIPEVATRIASVLSDEVQIITDVPPDQLPGLESAGTLKVDSIASNNAHFFYMNANAPELADKRMRQGLSLAIDRQLLVDSLWMGHAELMSSYQVPEWGSLYNPDRPLDAYDPERARQLIEESGYDGTEIVFRAPATYYTLGADAAQAVVAMWQEVGVNARVELTDDPHNPEGLQVAFWSAGLAPTDPTMNFTSLYGPTSTIQTNFWTPEDAAFNANIAALTTTLDETERAALYQGILDIFTEEVPATLLYRVHQLYAQRSDIGWTPYWTFEMDLSAANIEAGS